RQHHLTTEGLFGGGNRDLFAFLAHEQAPGLAALAVRPEHERDYLSLQALLAQSLAQVVGKAANGGASFVGIGGMGEAHASILAERWCVGNDKAGILTASHGIDPGAKI